MIPEVENKLISNKVKFWIALAAITIPAIVGIALYLKYNRKNPLAAIKYYNKTPRIKKPRRERRILRRQNNKIQKYSK